MAKAKLGQFISPFFLQIFLLRIRSSFLSLVFNGMVLLVLGFLISPLGLRAVIEWFIDRMADLNDSLKDFVMG